MTAHHKTREAVLQELGSDPASGLLPEQIEAKHTQYGENKLREEKKKTLSWACCRRAGPKKRWRP